MAWHTTTSIPSGARSWGIANPVVPTGSGNASAYLLTSSMTRLAVSANVNIASGNGVEAPGSLNSSENDAAKTEVVTSDGLTDKVLQRHSCCAAPRQGQRWAIRALREVEVC